MKSLVPMTAILSYFTLASSALFAQSGVLPGDYDGDGVISLTDFAALRGCLAGPNAGPVSPQCAPGDFDVDGHVELRDIRSFLIQFQAEECTYNPFDYRIWELDAIRTIRSADMNNDGHPDLLATKQGVPSNPSKLSISLGLGNARFAPPIAYQIGQHDLAIDIGDIDADGNLDVVVSGDPTRQDITVYKGDGQGQLAELETHHFTTTAVGIPVLADVDSNGSLDIVLWTTAGVASLLNDGTGVFAAPVFSTILMAVENELVDFNGDGRLDLVGRRWGSNSGLSVALGNGDGTFALLQDYYPTNIGIDATPGNFNNDGIPDFAAILTHEDDIVILLGDGSGSFTESARYSLLTHSLSEIEVADLNHDNNLDILSIASNGLSVFLGDGTGSLQLSAVYWPGLGDTIYEDLTLADINGDSHLDILPSRGYLGFLLGFGDGSFSAPMSYDIDADDGIAVDDFDGDGDLDVAAFDYDEISILVNDSAGQLDLASTIDVMTTSTSNMISADISNDGDPDLLWISWAQLFTMQGKEGSDFEEPVPYQIGSGGSLLTTADYNGDGIRDVIVGQGERLLIIPGIGGGALGAYSALEMGSTVSDIGAHDINFDGRDELFVLNKTTGELVVLMAHEDGGWSQVAAETTLNNPKFLYLEDVNQDGVLDAIVTIAGQVGIHLGRGFGSFDPVVIMETEGTDAAAATSDIDGDSRVDIVLTRPNDGVDIYYGLGNGEFQYGSSSSFLFVWINGHRKSLVACDMNNDDRADFVSFESQSISVMLNKCGF